MNGRRWITKWWLSMIGITLLTLGSLQAQTTTTPSIKLVAVKIELSGSVRLAWTRPAAVKVDSFFVYRFEGDNMSKGVKILATQDTTFTDVLPMTFVAVSKYSYYVVGKPATGSLITSNTVTVQIAGIPTVGSYKLTATTDPANAAVKLSWTKPPVDSVVKYYIYRTSGMLTAFFLVDSTTATSITNYPPMSSASGAKISGGNSSDAGMYMFTYFVKAKLPSGVQLQSTSALVYFTITVKKDTLTFLTTPVTTAQVNVAYTAKVLAKSSDATAKLTYVLDEYPKGMTLDVSSTTPLLKWTPAAKGNYEVKVIVKSDKNGEAKQNYWISVAGGNGIVYGKVVNTADSAIAKVIIQIIKRDTNRDACFSYATTTNQYGEYRFTKLDPGTYILQAIPTTLSYIGQWYNGKYNADNATPVIVSDSSAVPSGSLVNFKLLSRSTDTTKYVIVKGSVRDTLLLPVNVKGTQVTLVNSEFALNSSTTSTDVTIDNFKKIFDYDKTTDFRIQGVSKYSYHAPVDSLGNFSVKVPQGSYIALAKAPGYVAEFFKEHADLLSADIMKLTVDSANINFTLAPLPPIQLSAMSGSVLDTVKDIGVRARIVAFRDTWSARDGYKIAKAYFTDTDSLGKYAFTDLLPGSYIVLAMPVGTYAPAYYTGGVLIDTTKWWKVSKVVLDSGKNVSGIDIVVKELSASKSGFTWIKGTVKNGKMFGVAGAIVFAHDANKQPVGYGVSDNSGNYAILGLAPGTYSVTIDKPGYTWSESAVSASPSYSVASLGTNTVGVSNISFTLDAIQTVTGVETQGVTAVPTGFTVGQNYPNPFNPSTKFQFSLPAAQLVKVKVFDMLGREVATLVNRQMNAGTYTVEWNAASAPTGIYFYRVEAGSSSAVKKMILLK